MTREQFYSLRREARTYLANMPCLVGLEEEFAEHGKLLRGTFYSLSNDHVPEPAIVKGRYDTYYNTVDRKLRVAGPAGKFSRDGDGRTGT